ncbi:M20 family metallopeptidase [Nocardiopsis coralliicola]
MDGTPTASGAGAAPAAPASLADTGAAVAFTRDLVRVRSVHEPATGSTEQAAAGLVAERMRAFGWNPQVSEAAPGRPNVVAVIEGGGGPGPTLMFEGHTDVVSEGVRSAWTTDPYGAELRDGRIYGRGSADMKSGVAAMLYAAAAVQAAGPFPGRIVVGALADEEGLMLGAKHFAASPLAAEVDAAIICEPEEGEICTAAKGAVRFSVELHGRMAHGAMPQHARNPVAAAGPVLAAVAGYEAELQRAHGDHPLLGLPYLTPTVLSAGDTDQINVIPARAALCVDARTLPGMDHAALAAEVRARAAAAAEPHGVAAETAVIDDRPAVEIGADAPVVAALAAAHTAATGEPPRFGGVPGATDGTILTRDAGIPTVVYGPGGKWIAHQADEYVAAADIVRCTRIYADAALRFLTGRS